MASSLNGFIKTNKKNNFNPFIKPKGDSNSNFGIIKTGNKTYEYIGPPVSDVSQIFGKNLLPSTGQFYLKYNIKMKNDILKINASCRRAVNGDIAQSGLTLLDQTFSFSGSVYYPVSRTDDDKDSLFLLPDGTGIITTSNINIPGTTYDMFKEGANMGYGIGSDAVFGSFIPNFSTKAGSSAGLMVSFPLTNSMIFLSKQDNCLYINSSGAVPLDTNTSNILGLLITGNTNRLITFSDGINSCLVYSAGATNITKITVNFSNETYTTNNYYFTGYTPPDVTEEDPFGDVLYMIDGGIAYHESGYWYTDNTPWIEKTSIGGSNSVYMSPYWTFNVGMDLYGSFGSDGYIWFADYDHDNGASTGNFFGSTGTEDTVFTRKTNILCLKYSQNLIV